MGSGGTHAVVEQVKIERIDETSVSFSTRTASKTGLADDCLLRTFTCPLSEVWTAPINGAPPPVAMRPGAIGCLYLSRAGWDTRSADGYMIFGATTGLPNFKYPDAAAAPRMISHLMVIPTRLVVRGTPEGGSEAVELDLLGSDVAQAQEIAWSGADFIEVRLTQRGSQRLHHTGCGDTLRVWPTRFTVTGAPAVEPTLTGEVDLLNSELAALVQRVSFTRHGAPISLALTQDGFSAFHVVPGMTAPLSPPVARRSPHR